MFDVFGNSSTQARMLTLCLFLFRRGPNWIHGTNDNPIMQIARDTGTILHAWDEEQNIFDSQGEPLSPDEASEYGRLLWDEGLIAAAFKYSNEHSKSIPASKSLYDFFEEKVKDLFTDIPADEAERKRKTLVQTISMWGAYVGSPVERQSLKFFFLEECIEGENPFVAGTYEKILEAVAKPAREKATIRLETKVVRVVSDGTNHGKGRTRPELEIADGTRLAFDEVVCTMPLGMCFSHRITALFHVKHITHELLGSTRDLNRGHRAPQPH
jgi:hypothetical protein